MAGQKRSIETREMILKAAGRIFSLKGYRATTIAEICQQAGSNIASVNYHFGDKDTLYVEAWRHALQYSYQKYPLDGGVAAEAPAEERLRGWVRGTLQRMMDPDCYEFEIMHMEMADPTGLLAEVFMQEVLLPFRSGLMSILHELLGSAASEQDLQLCEMSVHAQCMNPIIFDRRHGVDECHQPLPKPPRLDAELETIVEHVLRFSLGGLEATRREIEAREVRQVKRRT